MAKDGAAAGYNQFGSPRAGLGCRGSWLSPRLGSPSPAAGTEQVTPRHHLGFWALPPWSQLWEGGSNDCSCVAAFHGA